MGEHLGFVCLCEMVGGKSGRGGKQDQWCGCVDASMRFLLFPFMCITGGILESSILTHLPHFTSPRPGAQPPAAQG